MSDRVGKRDSDRKWVVWLVLGGLLLLGVTVSTLVGDPTAVAGLPEEQKPARITVAPDGSDGSERADPGTPEAEMARKPDGEKPSALATRLSDPAADGGSPEADRRSAEESASSVAAAGVGSPSADSATSSLDRDDLAEIGELGFLPGLVQALNPASDCVFDDALSTCQ